MKSIKRILATLCFIIIFVVIFGKASDLLMHKQVEGRWNMTAKVAGFFNEEPNCFDVLFFGSSHMYCSVDPSVFKEVTGLNSYVFATQQQPLWITYHYMVEALKTQTPQLIVVEINKINEQEDFMDEGTNYTAIDPIRLSKNKIDMIYESVPKGQYRYYIFNIMKYHERWEELDELDYVRDYERETDPDKGYVRLTSASNEIVREDVTAITEVKVGAEKSMLYLNKIIDLAQEENIRLVLLKAPSNATAEEKMFYNGVARVADARGVDYVDYNDDQLYKEVGLDLMTDFYDQRHLNESGMKKFVDHFGRILIGGDDHNVEDQ
ncbi:MAG: hypothetical protein PHR60_01390 [Eubacteriales bacterium]|nr:hypothetical protein [Eubacteriales bacterium]MDD4582825.1 hypothetical protein [Eubacteriales bacterium]